MEFTITPNTVPRVPALKGRYMGETRVSPAFSLTYGVADGTYGINWGYGIGDGFKLVGEYGFFYNAMYWDKVGIYQDSSIATKEGLSIIKKYSPPQNLIPFVLQSINKTKYKQPLSSIRWGGVVLAGQNPLDMNIAYTKSFKCDFLPGHDKYMSWYEDQCKKYGKSLFVKIHPFIYDIRPWGQIFVDVAKRYGCSAGVCNMDILDHCEKLVTYSSTMILEAWMRGLPVEIGGTSAFKNVPEEMREQFINFLMYKYCIPTNVTEELLFDIFRMYRDSDTLYPVPEYLSWARWAIDNLNSAYIDETNQYCLDRKGDFAKA